MKQAINQGYQAVVIGTSAGGLNALSTLLPTLPANFPLAVIVVQHIREGSDNYIVTFLDSKCELAVIEAADKMPIEPGIIYLAPPGYHLLVERSKSLALCVDAPVNYCRPAIDLLFQTAAIIYHEHLIGIILTGANHDGSQGLKQIKQCGGLVIAEDPATAAVKTMPQAAIQAVAVDYILPLPQISATLLAIVGHSPCP